MLLPTEERSVQAGGRARRHAAVDRRSAQAAKELVAAAHKVCPYSNATRGNIDVKLTVNGEPVE